MAAEVYGDGSGCRPDGTPAAPRVSHSPRRTACEAVLLHRVKPDWPYPGPAWYCPPVDFNFNSEEDTTGLGNMVLRTGVGRYEMSVPSSDTYFWDEAVAVGYDNARCKAGFGDVRCFNSSGQP